MLQNQTNRLKKQKQNLIEEIGELTKQKNNSKTQEYMSLSLEESHMERLQRLKIFNMITLDRKSLLAQHMLWEQIDS